MTDTKPSAVRELLDVFATVAWALGIALVLRVLLFQPFTIPSGSMEPGLLIGDYLIVSKFDYGWSRHSLPLSPPLPGEGRIFARTAARGDVVVFKKPGDERTAVIKRVIGLPGDRVQIKAGAVWLNGRPVTRRADGRGKDPADPGVPVGRFLETLGGHTYVTLDRGPDSPGDDTEVYLVPAGHYFVMGDNRDNSADSRWPEGLGMGFVPAENLVGRARLVLASWEPGASVLEPWTWANLRGGRFVRPIP